MRSIGNEIASWKTSEPGVGPCTNARPRRRAGCSLSEIVNQNDVAASVVLLPIREPPAIRRNSHNVVDLPWRRAECPHLPSGEVEELKGIPVLSALHEVNAVRGGHEVPVDDVLENLGFRHPANRHLPQRFVDFLREKSVSPVSNAATPPFVVT